MANINDSYFDGLYKEIWRSSIPEILTQRETDFIISYFRMQPGMKVLDLMCGYGRHALALARKGMEVTAVDNLGAYIREINDQAAKESLPIHAVRADILGFVPAGKFDLSLIMGNSLNFFNAEDSGLILRQISDSLVPGGQLLINTWSLAEIAIPGFREKSSSLINGIECNSESKYLLRPARMESHTKFITPAGEIEEKEAVDYIFSLNEMESLLQGSGLCLLQVFSIPGKKIFSLGEPRAYLIAQKIN